MGNGVPLTPLGRVRAENTGACGALVCRAKCELFEPSSIEDTFPICACGHTQHVHAKRA